MSIIRFQGDVKNGKTASAVGYTFGLAARMMEAGLPIGPENIWTNLTNCYDHDARNPDNYDENGVWKPRAWGTTIEIDDLIADMMVENEEDGRFWNGILLWDEAQALLSTAATRGRAGDITLNVMNQLGKRGIELIYTTHMEGNVAPTIRGITVADYLCIRDRRYPDTILWELQDKQAERLAYARGQYAPPRIALTLKHIHKLFGLYDSSEVGSPFASTLTAMGKGNKQLMKAFDNLAARKEAEGVRVKGIDQIRAEIEASKPRERGMSQKAVRDLARSEAMQAAKPIAPRVQEAGVI